MVFDYEGYEVYGEVNIDQFDNVLQELMFILLVLVICEVVEVIVEVDLIFIGLGSFYISLLLILLFDEMVWVLCCILVLMVFIDNFGKEYSLVVRLLLVECIVIMECYVGKWVVDVVIVGLKVDISGIDDWLVIQMLLEVSDVFYCYDWVLFCGVLEKVIQLLG